MFVQVNRASQFFDFNRKSQGMSVKWAIMESRHTLEYS